MEFPLTNQVGFKFGKSFGTPAHETYGLVSHSLPVKRKKIRVKAGRGFGLRTQDIRSGTLSTHRLFHTISSRKDSNRAPVINELGPAQERILGGVRKIIQSPPGRCLWRPTQVRTLTSYKSKSL